MMKKKSVYLTCHQVITKIVTYEMCDGRRIVWGKKKTSLSNLLKKK